MTAVVGWAQKFVVDTWYQVMVAYRFLALFAVLTTFTLFSGICQAAPRNVKSKVCKDALAPLPMLRILTPLQQLNEKFMELKDLPIETVIERVVAGDVRNLLFRAEAAARIYEEIYSEEFEQDFEALLIKNGYDGAIPLRDMLKLHEDLIGHYSDFNEELLLAKRLYMPAKVIAYLQKVRNQKLEEYAEHLMNYWVAKPQKFSMYKVIEVALKRVKWKQNGTDTKNYIKRIRQEVTDIEDGLLSGDFDPEDLEGGIHELRRKLRWILLYFQASQGLILLDGPEPEEGKPYSIQPGTVFELNEYSYLLNHPIVYGPFSRLVVNEKVSDPVVIPRYLFLALSKVVEELGKIKSQGEKVEALAHALVAAKEIPELERARRVTEQVLRDHDLAPYQDVSDAATAILSELERTGLLAEIRAHLRSQKE